ncbi:hypothetical protein AAY473_018178 [Plecturocebus cupreus]
MARAFLTSSRWGFMVSISRPHDLPPSVSQSAGITGMSHHLASLLPLLTLKELGLVTNSRNYDVRSVSAGVGFWMVRCAGFLGSCFSSLGLELRLLSCPDLSLVCSFAARPRRSAAVVPAFSLAPARGGSLALSLALLALLALALAVALALAFGLLFRLHSSLAFLAALRRRVRRLRGLRGATGVLRGPRAPSSGLARPGFLLGFGTFQTLK